MSNFIDDFEPGLDEQQAYSLDDRQYINRHLGNARLLTRAEEVVCSERARAGDVHALDALVRHNVRLVVAVAHRFRPSDQSFSSGGVEFADLVQEGLDALTRAARLWDPARSASFATYAQVAITRQMSAAISAQEDAIRIPYDARALGNKMRALQETRSHQGFDELSTAELAAHFEVSENNVIAARDAAKVTQSLNRPVGEDGTDELINLLADPTASDFAEDVMAFDPRQLREALGRLKPREREIIVQRYAEGRDIQAIAKDLGVSPSRVRLQEKRGLAKFRKALGVDAEGNLKAPRAHRDAAQIATPKPPSTGSLGL